MLTLALVDAELLARSEFFVVAISTSASSALIRLGAAHLTSTYAKLLPALATWPRVRTEELDALLVELVETLLVELDAELFERALVELIE
jgi:hypothetical protein